MPSLSANRRAPDGGRLSGLAEALAIAAIATAPTVLLVSVLRFGILLGWW